MQDRVYQTIALAMPGFCPSRESIAPILSLFEFRALARGEVWYRPGQKRREIALILGGVVRHYLVDARGRERTTDFCRAGEFTGVTGEADGVYARDEIWLAAACEAELAVAPSAELLAAVASVPEAHALFSGTVLRYLEMKTAREGELLGLDPAERYAAFVRNFPELLEQVPQYLIASYLGLTPEALSRVRRRRLSAR